MPWLLPRERGASAAGPSTLNTFADPSPPEWTAAAEPSHQWGLVNEASESDFLAAERFCANYPVESPKLLDSWLVERIRCEKAAAWRLEIPSGTTRFSGVANNQGGIRICTHTDCEDVTLLSNFPIIGGCYSREDQHGVYYEITVDRMDPDAVVAFGSVCRPYPEWRLPGWNRLSAGLHLDDMRKFFEDPTGGRDYTGSDNYLQQLQRGDIFGFGYEFATGNIFFTRNGGRLTDAFIGKYLPRGHDLPGCDVYAAIGMCGRTEVGVNFGAEPFVWKEANMPQWRVECHVGRLGDMNSVEDEPPPYALTAS